MSRDCPLNFQNFIFILSVSVMKTPELTWRNYQLFPPKCSRNTHHLHTGMYTGKVLKGQLNQKCIFFLFPVMLFINLDSFGVSYIVGRNGDGFFPEIMIPLHKIIHRPCCEVFYVGKKVVPWIILCNMVMISGKRHYWWVFQMYFCGTVSTTFRAIFSPIQMQRQISLRMISPKLGSSHQTDG